MPTCTALVVGGTSGIGFACGLDLAANGYDQVWLGGRQAPDAHEGGDKALPDNVRYLPLDVTNETSLNQAISQCERLDALVFTAGVAAPKVGIADLRLADLRPLFDINVLGALATCAAAYTKLVASKGNVVVVGSVAGRSFSRVSGVGYAASKAALAAAVRQLAVEAATDGVRINAVHPSMTLTPMLEAATDAEQRQDIANAIPLGRIATPQDVVAAIRFLLSAEASYITGAGLDINGGLFPSA